MDNGKILFGTKEYLPEDPSCRLSWKGLQTL
jgi:hypothetical protein